MSAFSAALLLPKLWFVLLDSADGISSEIAGCCLLKACGSFFAPNLVPPQLSCWLNVPWHFCISLLVDLSVRAVPFSVTFQELFCSVTSLEAFL